MTAALITVYNPTADVSDNIRTIAAQVDAVHICDNSAYDNGSLFQNIPGNICYTRFGENLGLSCAFNRVLKAPDIHWQPDDYVCFFDQDSAIVPGHMDALRAVYEDLLGNGHKVGCLGPAFFNTSSGRVEMPKQKTEILPDTFAVSSVITSSMLCRYGELEAVGFWNEDIFLDMADWDLCWRLLAEGKLCCMTGAVVFRHSVGSGERKIGPLRLRVGQPFREYYQIRDCLHLFRKPYTPLKYRIRFLAMVFVRSPLHLLFLDNRKARASYIGKGIADYFRKKRGALELSGKAQADSHT